MMKLELVIILVQLLLLVVI
ncbi:MAG: hypothetical protein REH79_00945 [Spiroplasma sp.]|nr:hypothetical protein [Spiroplasma sp.]